MSAAIGAAIAVLTGIGAGFGIGLATSKAVEAVADSLKQQTRSVQLSFRMCSCRGNSYLRFRYRSADLFL